VLIEDGLGEAPALRISGERRVRIQGGLGLSG
jgi:hypothetical protein